MNNDSLNKIDWNSDQQNYQECHWFYGSPAVFILLTLSIFVMIIAWLCFFYHPSHSLHWRVPYGSVLIVVYLLFAKYKIIINNDGVQVFSGLFNVRTHCIPHEAISSTEVINFRTVFDWRGIGSRYGKDDKWTFLKMGKQGVIIKTRNGDEYIVESSAPQKLNEMILFFKK
ncbi:MAG: hypothetical protein ACRC2T_03580 [Thermoguttaceae bacterium]